MFEQDQQAAHATDIMLAQRLDPQKEGLSGWIVEDQRPESRVRFIREQDGNLEAAYDVAFKGDAPPSLSVPQDRTLSATEVAQFKARSLALHNISRPCSKSYNTVALHDPESDGWLVWALAATTEPGAIVVGGHYRFTISSDGSTVLRRDALSASCLAMKKNSIPQGNTPVAAFMTHVVSPTPIETHVFLSLLHQTPFIVGTGPKQNWQVADGRIVLLQPK